MSEDFSAIRPLLEEYAAIERDMADDYGDRKSVV